MTNSTRPQRAYSIIHYTEFPTVFVTVFKHAWGRFMKGISAKHENALH